MAAQIRAITGSRKLEANSSLGFTLIELLIVMSVLGAMGVILLMGFGPANQQKARDAIRRSDLKQYATSLEVFANANNGLYPAGSGNLTARCGDLDLTPAECKNDPNGGNYIYFVNAARTEYFTYATLEYEPTGATEYYIVCSNGLAGEDLAMPGGLPCPL